MSEVLELLRYRLRVLTPMVVTSSVGYRGLLHTTLRNLVPGSVVRGAILTELMREGGLSPDCANRLARSPDFAVTPAYLADRPERRLCGDLMVAHALCFASKWAEDVGGRRARVVVSPGALKLRTEAPPKLVKLISSFLRSMAEKRGLMYAPGEVKPVQGAPAALVDGRWVLVPSETTSYVGVAMEHGRGAAAPEMLFAYELVAPGATYVGLMAVSEGSPLLDAVSQGRVYVSVGRGVTRGFGRAELTFERAELPEAEPLKAGDLVVLEAVSPTSAGPALGPPAEGAELRLDESWLMIMLGEEVRASFRVRLALGRVATYAGWSLRTRMPKLPLRALDRGGLVVAEVTRDVPSSVASLLHVVGLDRLASSGFNQLYLLTRDPFEGVA